MPYVHKMPSGKWRAEVWVIPGKKRTGQTFLLKKQADDWAREQETAITRGEWRDPRRPGLLARRGEAHLVGLGGGTRRSRGSLQREPLLDRLGLVRHRRVSKVRCPADSSGLMRSRNGRPRWSAERASL